MADDTGEAGIADRFAPKQPGPGRSDTPPAPPPRPPIAYASPAPIKAPTPPPGSITASRSLWVTSFVVGFLAIGLAFLARTAQLDELQELISDLMPGETESTLERAAQIAYWACVGGLVVVIVAEALLLRLVMNRRRVIRWVMLLFLFVHAGVAVAADAFLALGDAGLFVRLLLATQLLLAGIAAVVALLPGAGRWLRGERGPGQGA
jgi:hypothetical protein